MRKICLLLLSLVLFPVLLFADPQPNVTILTPSNALFSEAVTMEISFSNSSVTLGETGYYPIVQVILPAGFDCAGGNCSSAFSWTSPSGSPVDVTTIAESAGVAINPVTGESVVMPVGGKLLIIKAPTGTLSVGQPAVTAELELNFNANAILGNPEVISARGIFVYGDIPNGVVSDCGGVGDTLCQAEVTSSVTPTILTARKIQSSLVADATGPNYPRLFTITADVASTKTVENLVVTDTLPGSIVLINPPASDCTGSAQFTIVPSPDTCVFTANVNGGGSFVATFNSLVGAAGNDITVTYRAYVQEFLDNDGSTDLISPVSGSDTSSNNSVAIDYDFDPGSGLIAQPQVLTSVSIPQRASTLRKTTSVTDNAPTGNSPDDVINYTTTFYVSDYFDFANLSFQDLIQDGQTYNIGSFSARVVEDGFDVTISNETNFNGHVTVAPKDLNGVTEINFDLSSALNDAVVYNHADAILDGDRLSSGVPTRVVITYSTTIDEEFVGPVVGGATQIIDSHDNVDNQINSASTVNATANPRNLSSSTTVEIVPITQFSKATAFKNGAVPPLGTQTVSPGDEITYKLTLALPIGDVEGLVFKDYLPTPLFEAIDPVADNSNLSFSAIAQGDTAPAPGEWRYTSASTITPALTISQVANDNSITFDVGDIEDGGGSQLETIEILFTVVATNAPMGDGLKLVNVLFANNSNSESAAIVNSVNAIIDFVTDQPALTITKTDQSVVTGNALQATDGFTNAQAGDVLRFAVDITNDGGYDAFDVSMTDTLVPGFLIPGAGANLVITNVSGCTTTSFVNTSDLTKVSFTGLEIAPGGTCRAEYNLEIDIDQEFATTITNTARVTYTSQVGGTTFSPVGDTADVVMTSPVAPVKTFVTGSTNFASSVDPITVPGENLSFDVTATLPQGSATNFRIAENDQGTSLVSFATFSSVTYPQGPIIVCSHNPAMFSMTTSPDVCFTDGTPNVTTVADTITVNFGDIINYNLVHATADTLVARFNLRVDNVGTSGAKNNRGRIIYNANGVNDVTLNHTLAYTVQRPVLTRAKTSATVAPVNIGDLITYQITIGNTGNSPAFDTVITDVMGAGLGNATLVSATYNGSDVTGTASLVQVGQTNTITFLNTSSNPDIINGHSLVIVYTSQVLGTIVPDLLVGPGHTDAAAANAGSSTGCVSSVSNQARVSQAYSADSSSGQLYTTTNVSVSKTLDNDNDGILNSVEGCGDSDGDTVPDYLDTDSDDNAEPDIDEGTVDTDGDTIPDFQDPDNDGDGVPDIDEGSGTNLDTDGDGVPDYIDLDSDNDGILDVIEGNGDSDGDGVADYLDLDADNDGIADIIEAGGVDTNADGRVDDSTDTDNDGYANTFDSNNGGTALPVPNTDGDSKRNFQDRDSDNDGITDLRESLGADLDNNGIADGFLDANNNGWHDGYDGTIGGTPLGGLDTDSDGNLDRVEPDSDNDGILDVVEAQSANPTDVGYVTPGVLDTDSDGILDPFDVNQGGVFLIPGADLDLDTIVDYRDLDSDNDGIPDLNEGEEDTDGDSIPNYRDLDSDNDGVADIIEAGGVDADGNGILDNLTDTDLDGLANLVDPDNAGTPLPLYDTDTDGFTDHLDLDSDNDGISDLVENNQPDVGNNGMVDGFVDTNSNGWHDAFDTATTGTNINLVNTEGDGLFDYRDTDSDNDTIPDYAEAQTPNPGDLPYRAPTGLDADGDGIDNAYDPGSSNAFLVPVDFDGDTVPDFRDLDTDNDGILDATEANHNTDTNGDTFPDYRDLDSDGDGIFDIIEAGGDDSNNNGIVDSATDTNGDGLANTFDTDNGGTALPITNTDGDAIPDFRELDSDADGIADSIETSEDFDNDGTANYQDLDSDDDGILDSIEGNVDTDADGQPDFLDLDSDNDGIPDATEGSGDKDGDGVRDFRDRDSDGDGIYDIIEAGGVDLDNNGVVDDLTDTDGDGLVDVVDPDDSGTPLTVPDTDGDTFPDYLDLDGDSDGIPDLTEGNIDTDGDGIADYLDLDSDNDGIADIVEAGGVDTDNDGLLDSLVDTDSDGLANIVDVNNGGTPLSSPDTDGDGVLDSKDLDSDNDGLSDLVESEGVDANNDGLVDTFTDTNSNGWHDAYDGNILGTALDNTDTDADLIPDRLETDSDNDGILDVVEAQSANPSDGGYLVPGLVDTDSDGIFDPFDADQAGAFIIPNNLDGDTLPDYRDLDTDSDGVIDSVETDSDTDGDSVPDYRDLDADNDGISDLIEVGGVDSNNNGILDSLTDSDADGLADIIDSDNGGVPLTDIDTDGDSNPDRVETDSDNDGINDYQEGQSLNPADVGYITPGVVDTDGDGILDEFDLDSLGSLTNPIDFDSDGIPDYQDLDSDNDGILDNVESGADLDSDTIPNYRDLDSDNDGIADIIEAGGVDTNGDGQVENDTDTDGDGYADTFDTDNGGTALLDLNTDSDSMPDRLDLDSDNDGISDLREAGGLDADNNGLVDSLLDANDNGWHDGYDTATLGTNLLIPNTDGDALPNYRDTDSDQDTIPDFAEAQPANPADVTYIEPLGTDADSDGIDDSFDLDLSGAFIVPNDLDGDTFPDYIDQDTDSDGIPDLTEADQNLDTDLDTRPNYRDLDNDGDGIFDIIEGGGDDLDNNGVIDDLTDTDGDGLADTVDTDNGGTDLPLTNTDGDSTPDYLDLDSDADGISDNTEGNTDFDGDGIPNFQDLDSDADGISDLLEGNIDTDGDGHPNYLDLDSDNDGILDSIEDDVDTDGDTVPDYLDLDSDGDTIFDIIEAGGVDLNDNGTVDVIADTDNDGLADIVDSNNGGTALLVADQDADGLENYIDLDADGDGLPDSVELDLDTDGDGVADFLDLDVDNDGLPDLIEAGGVDANRDGLLDDQTDTDGDGLADLVDTDNAGTALVDPDTDGDTIVDHLDLDADNDGIADIVEAGGVDTNGDGRVDSLTDVDADGLSDIVDPTESGTALLDGDTDSDTVVDRLDLDADDDGISDLLESDGADTDNNGLVDGLADTNNNGWHDGYDTTTAGTNLAKIDTDGDGDFDFQDTDSDNDTIFDFAEAQSANPLDVSYNPPSSLDTDGDGIDDAFDSDQGGAFIVPVDTDADSAPDFRDLDTDNDGILDAIEADQDRDTDSDTIPDYRDLDSDGDGLFDIIEVAGGGLDLDNNGQIDISTDTDGDGIPDLVDSDNGGTPLVVIDTNNDTTPDFQQLDSDGDGIPDSVEGSEDFDGDGTPNFQDTDSDGDGILDATEGSIDFDGDGHPNYLDLDSDNDGVPDSSELGTDSDGDGVGNYLDLDSDNDGISDLIEAGGEDTDNNGILDDLTDTDSDGLSNLVDTDNSGIPLALPDSDSDGRPNYLDIDADGDGIVDNIEAQGEFAYVAPTGLDSDSDGIDDAYDRDQSGIFIIPVNTELLDTPDYLDLDSDNDGVPDRIEGHDADHDGVADNIATNIDSDNDGLDDAFDNFDFLLSPSNWGVNIIGSNSALQDTDSDLTRDWRDTDDDNDTIPTIVEDANNNTDFTDDDFDIDGTPNYLEPNDVDDHDGDGIKNDDEVLGGTDPCDPDTDNDGLLDGEEVVNGQDGFITNPLDADSDDDAISDGGEMQLGTNPLLADTDADGLTDGIEVGAITIIAGGVSECTGISYEGSNPSTPLDQCPQETATSPLIPDSDQDGMLDGAEDANQDGCFNGGETDPADGLDACTTTSTHPISIAIDGSALNLTRQVPRAAKVGTRIATRYQCPEVKKKKVKANNAEATASFTRLWGLAWSAIPELEFACTPIPTLICEDVSLVAFKGEATATGVSIADLAEANLTKCARKTKLGKRFLKSVNEQYLANFNQEVAVLPDEMLVCNQ